MWRGTRVKGFGLGSGVCGSQCRRAWGSYSGYKRSSVRVTTRVVSVVSVVILLGSLVEDPRP